MKNNAYILFAGEMTSRQAHIFLRLYERFSSLQDENNSLIMVGVEKHEIGMRKFQQILRENNVNHEVEFILKAEEELLPALSEVEKSHTVEAIVCDHLSVPQKIKSIPMYITNL